MLNNPLTEQWLTDSGVVFRFVENLKLDSIDRVASLRNQARVGEPLIEDVVLMYATALENGDQFPPIVVYEASKRPLRYVVVDGNHRTASADLADRNEFAAYIITGASENQIRTLTYEANLRHGVPIDLEGRIRYAVNLIDTVGVSQRDVARQVGIPLSKVEAAYSLWQIDNRLQSANVRNYEKVSPWTRRRINNIRSDRVLSRMAQMILKAPVKQDEVSRIVTEVNRFRTEDEALRYLATVERSLAPTRAMTVGGKARVPRELVYLSQVLTRAENLDEEKIASHRRAMNDEYRAKVQEKIAHVREKFERIAQTLR